LLPGHREPLTTDGSVSSSLQGDELLVGEMNWTDRSWLVGAIRFRDRIIEDD
jgi:hypothetical protein